ncbi:MAG: heme-binding protein [Gammaproteobacteria bacterium]
MNTPKVRGIAAALMLVMATVAGAGLPVKRVLTLEAAQNIAEAAKAEADERGATVVIAVVDDGGQLILLERLDHTQVASVDVGIGKARTAAIFRRPSKEFEDQIRDGRVAALALPGATPLQGGLPIVVGNEVVGAIGVSGNTPQEDEDIAKAGLAAFAQSQDSPAAPVSYFPAAQVTEAFAVGEPLIEQANYKVHASHRTEPGVVEVHTRDTDTIYVLAGKATFVTGGRLLDGEEIAPEEIRGSKLRGGQSREIAKGDVVVVPNGVPHWFKAVSNPFDYYVVKVRSAQ